MYRILLPLLCLATLAAGEVQYAPLQARIVTPDKTIAPAFVFFEALDKGVVFSLQKENAAQSMSEVARNKYLRVEFDAVEDDVNWLKGNNAIEKNDLAAAVEPFRKAAENSRYHMVREESWLRLAECLLKLNKGADADAALAKFTAAFPKSVRGARAADLRAAALDLKGDAKAALAAYGELAKSKEIDAAARGARGVANLLAKEKKHAEAAKAVLDIFAKLSPEREPALFAELGILLAQQQVAASEREPAFATLRRLAFNLADATGRAQAHLEWAKALRGVGDPKSLFLAYDQAVLAASAKGADGKVTAEAQTLARSIVSAIDKLPADVVSDADKGEYRRYR
jgi:hypothetical protein